ncbi:hypothetical protein [Legionella londiniensis]|nr:hypothetical protein [Legionella londiniensis]
MVLSLQSEDTLSEKQLREILLVFAQRWQLVTDTEYDYMINPKGINHYWIQLAKELAFETNRTYLQVLIPSATNIFDPLKRSPLIECSDLREFYLSHNGTTLHRTKGLFENIQQGKSFYTHESDQNQNIRPLTLSELFRIRKKTGAAFTFKNKKYSSFWNYLEREALPAWQKRGECPRHLLTDLLELVENYLDVENHDYKDFQNRFDNWLNTLYSCPVNDVNWLYGQKVSCNNKSDYLINVLIDLSRRECSPKLQRILALARWLCTFDPSLISKHPKLQGLYQELGLGPGLTAEILIDKLQKLAGEEVLQKGIHLVILQLKNTKKIDPFLIEKLQEIYAIRWLKILDTNLDYTRLQSEDNKEWILVAQTLAGAGYISKDYYRFLMPTLTHDEDAIQLVRLSNYPLSHYILSEDGKSLLLLDNCAAHFHANGTFYNCYTTPAVPLTRKELKRLGYSKPFEKYIHLIQSSSVRTDPPLQLRTVKAVYNLVNESCYSAGLMAGHNYDITQMQAAERAYLKFYSEFNQLPFAERENLIKQQIIMRGVKKSFAEVLQGVTEGNCIALSGKYFAQMVMDYAPFWDFTEEVERHFSVSEMRQASQGKVFLDYGNIDDQEALRRLLILTAAVMVRKFYYWPFSHCTLYAYDFSNTVPDEINEIFSRIIPILNASNYAKARAVYVAIIESAVKPLREVNWWIRLRLNQATLSWINSIGDGSFFEQKNIWFEPESLFSALWLCCNHNPKLRQLLSNIMDQQINIALKPMDENLKRLQINILFLKFLETLGEKEKQEILEQLEKKAKMPLDRQEYYKSCAEFLTYRIISEEKGWSSKQSSIRFFSNASPSNRLSRQQIQKKLAIEPNVQFESLNSLISMLQIRLESELECSFAVDKYWQSITGRSLNVPISAVNNGIPKLKSY